MSNYHDSMSELTFTQEQKDRMAKAIAERARAELSVKQSGEASRHSVRRRRFSLAAAAAIVLALVLGAGGIAYATGGLLSAERLIDNIFNGEPAPTEIVERIGRPIGASVTDNGITVTANAILGDRTSYTIIYTIEKADGSAFDVETNSPPYLPYAMEGGITTPPPSLGLISRGFNGAAGESFFIDEDPDDNAIQYVERVILLSNTGIANISGATMDTAFSELRHYDANDEVDFAVQGNWNFRFSIEYEDLSVQVPVRSERFSLLEGEATMTEMYVSPVSLSFKYVVDEPANYDPSPSGQMSEEMDAEVSRLLDLGDISFTMRDGTTIVQEDRSGGGIGADNRSCDKSLILDTMIDVEELESITIGGTTFSMD